MGTTAGSVSHVEAKKGKCIREDIIDPDQTVSSGNVSLADTASTYVEVGLNYSVEVVTQPVELRLPTGSMQGQKVRIVEASPIMYQTQNLTVNGKEVPTQASTSGSGGLTAFTGIKTIHGLTGYTLEGRVTLAQSQPVFMTVLGLEYKVGVGA